MEPDAATAAYVEHLHGRIVEVCRLACERLEPAWVRWGLGEADEAMNRRERDPDGMVRRIGWHPDGMADISVPVLQAIREDGSAVATIVGYGAHTVTTGVEVIAYSPDYPGPLRDAVRAMTGGECVFLQGAAGNIMPRVAFEDACTEWIRMGRRLALEAVHAVADRPAWPLRFTPTGFGSGTPVGLFRRGGPEGEQPALAAVEERVDLPLLPRPSREEIVALRERAEAEVREAEAAGATEPELRFLRFHGLNWLRRAEADICSEHPTASVAASINAVRIGDGAIVTGAGEVFTEIGLAVKERSPGRRHALRRLHQRLRLLPAGRERVPARRLRAGVRQQDLRPAGAGRAGGRPHPRRDRHAARALAVPRAPAARARRLARQRHAAHTARHAAAGAPGRGARMRYTAVDHISYTVADLDESIRWYSLVLDEPPFLRKVWDQEYVAELCGYPRIVMEGAFWRLPGGNVLELLQILEPDGTATDPEIINPGASHLGLACEDLRSEFARLKAAGVDLRSEEPVVIPWGPVQGRRRLLRARPGRQLHGAVPGAARRAGLRRLSYSRASTTARVSAPGTTGTISKSARPCQCSTHSCSRRASSHAMSWKQRSNVGSTQLPTYSSPSGRPRPSSRRCR